MTGKNINPEIGTTYDYSNVSPKVLRRNEDKFEQIIEKSGQFQLYEDMVLNEPIIGAFNNLIESFVSVEEFYFKPADTSEESKKYSDLIKEMFDDMEVPFAKTLKDWLTMCPYGFALSEIVLKKRLGYNPNNPLKHSRYNDGLIALRKFASRPQKTITKWNYDNYGRIESVEQSNPTNRKKVNIPYNRLLHFVAKSYNENPEGRSIYRNCAQSYFNKQRIRRTQAIRFERGFDGIPVIQLPAHWCDKTDTKFSSFRGWAEDTVKNVRMAQDSGIVMPRILDDNGKEMVTFEIKSGDAPIGQNPDEMIQRCDLEMATALLSDFFLSGKTASVSGSLGQVKISVFASFVTLLLSVIVDEINNKLIPLLFELNNFDKTYMPKLIHTNISKLNMVNIMLFVQSLSKHKLMKSTFERDNAITKLVFGNAMPEISREEWDRQQRLEEINYVDNLDNPTTDNFDDEFGKSPKEE